MSALEIRTNFERLAERVDEAGGLLSVRMGELRDLVQAGRLAPGPIGQVKHNLDRVGLAAPGLSHSHNDWALVYRRSSSIGNVIAAAKGDTEHAVDDLRAAIKEVAASDAELATDKNEELEELRATVDQIKALVAPV
ncbi:hypothetical protein [Nocardia iowensis]|uniref:Uncharacterized protein n=1 Tax=Nocardia iowensis TaxID=204891 RepID=A0ABX8RJE3_NOCIO|nr:hypothetical protein [Nocardia iowensis]QXN89740.1 hypothetical protein KV110_30350 [Nocardia iowensis]